MKFKRLNIKKFNKKAEGGSTEFIPTQAVKSVLAVIGFLILVVLVIAVYSLFQFICCLLPVFS